MKISTVLIIFSIATLLSILATNGDIENVFGIWSGDHLTNTVDHRIIQSEILLNRFFDNPFFGFGFGYFTPGYDDYGLLSLPYLLELDLINFFTKIGLPLSFIYIFTYILFIIKYFHNKFIYNNIEFSFLTTLILLLFYGLFQTSHSSFVFWFIYAMTFVFLFRKSF